MGNFLILFREREGSSPIIDLLSRHPQINVPVFEHMDWSNLKDHCTVDQVACKLDRLFKSGDFSKAVARSAQQGDFDDGSAPKNQGKCVGFKWRPWGEPEAIARVLKKHRVVVFHLFRYDLVELAVSLDFTMKVIPGLSHEATKQLGGHSQFAFARMNADEQKAAREILQDIRFRVDLPEITRNMQAIYEGKLQVKETYIECIKQSGLDVRSIIYEDFLGRRDEFVGAICRTLGLPEEPLASKEPWYKKIITGSILQQVENLDELNSSVQVRRTLDDYHKLIDQDHTSIFDG